jgi:ubiquinone/menaquinone biosynthesis C-methylase UbiE
MPHVDLSEARAQAHRLAMAPFAFQAARAARELGLLGALRRANLTADQLASATGLPQTSIDALLEACLAIDLVEEAPDDRWQITRVGRVWLVDDGVQADADFAAHVCWHGMADLPAALTQARPVGLRHLGPWATIYEGLPQLPAAAREAWFAYDHGHSDRAFGEIVERMKARPRLTILDVGANTGRFACALLTAHAGATTTMLDHPGQLALADVALTEAGVRDRATLHGIDLLDADAPFPGTHDVVWISQCLDCFGPADIVHILRRARQALTPGGEVWVLEVCPDRQSSPAAAASLRLTSLYFIALANGVSRFYRGSDYLQLAAEAGLHPAEIIDGLGSAHSLFVLRPSTAE